MRYKNIIILFFLIASFWFGSRALATDILDLDYSTHSNTLSWGAGWRVSGNRFTTTKNNISKIFMPMFGCNSNALASYRISICSGIPNNSSQADVEANGATCNWAGNSLVYTQLFTGAVCNTDATFLFTNPVGLTAGANYYYIITHGNTTYNLSPYYNSAGTGMILNQSQWVGNESFKTYYSDTYSPPSTFMIQLLTPSPTAPFTTFYGQPASYTFNYANPLGWYPMIRIDVRRKADARASAWPDFIPSGNFTTSNTGTATSTFGTASFKLPDGYYDLDAYFWANLPASPVHATTTFTINSGGTYGGYSFATSTLLTPPTFSTEDLCGDIATTTTFGAIECGLTKAFVNTITWAFAPSFDTLTNFKVSMELFKGCFPFNTYFQLTSTITNAASSTATTTTGTLKLPFIHTNGTYYMLDVISSSTISNWIGVSNYNLFRTTIGYFFWLIAVAVVYFTVKNI